MRGGRADSPNADGRYVWDRYDDEHPYDWHGGVTPYTALIARAMLIGRMDGALVQARAEGKSRIYIDNLTEQRDMAIALLIDGMHSRSIRTPITKVRTNYLAEAWHEVQEEMRRGESEGAA